MEKKHKNRFSIVFTEIDLQQKYAIEKLNSLPPRKLAVYIAQAIYAYETNVTETLVINSEKRKRNITRKSKNSKKTSDIPISSHIKNEHQAEKTVYNTDNDLNNVNLFKSKAPAVNNSMLQSMMSFIEKT